MSIPPQPRDNKHVLHIAGGRQQDMPVMPTPLISVRSGRGERLLPYVVAAMETCWVDAVLIALASANAFQLSTPLLPLWAPFLLIASACWLMILLERREAVRERVADDRPKRASGALLFGVSISLLVLIVVWARIYASAFLLIDPRWLLAVLNDLFLLDSNAYSLLVLIALSIYFCWRGIRLAHKVIEPESVFRTLRLGMGIIIVAVLIYTGRGAGSFSELILFGIVPLFLFLALVAHALAKAAFMRSIHPGGLQGSIAGQERAILMTMSLVGFVILVLTLGIGIFASPAFLADVQSTLTPVGRFYDWLVSIIAYAITFLAYPIFWLLSILHIKKSSQPIFITKAPITRTVLRSHQSDPIITFIVPVLKILLPALLIVLMVWLIWRLLSRRRGRFLRQEQQEIHESLWSGELFLTQFKEFLLAIWLHFFSWRPGKQEVVREEEPDGEATARSVRAIYRALLRFAARSGYGRKKEETPYEFKVRLQQKFPQGEPELNNLTKAYSDLRYGDRVLDEAELADVQMDWQTLQQKFLLP